MGIVEKVWWECAQSGGWSFARVTLASSFHIHGVLGLGAALWLPQTSGKLFQFSLSYLNCTEKCLHPFEKLTQSKIGSSTHKLTYLDEILWGMYITWPRVFFPGHTKNFYDCFMVSKLKADFSWTSWVGHWSEPRWSILRESKANCQITSCHNRHGKSICRIGSQ